MTTDELLDHLRQEIWRLRYDWNGFRFISATDPSRVDVLNAVAPGFFARWQQTTYERMLLGIARLFDSAKMSGNDNVSFAAILAASGFEKSDPARFARLSSALKEAKKACSGCIKHRHKRISHLDQKVANKVETLPAATLKLVDDALQACEGMLERLHEALGRGSVSFEVPNEEVEDLLRHLTNRRSQRLKDHHAEIRYRHGERTALLCCPFCDTSEEIAFYMNGVPSPAQMSRWHYDRCDGVIGCETIEITLIDEHGIREPKAVFIDLRRPTRETD